MERFISNEGVIEFAKHLMGRYRLWAPVGHEGSFVFSEVDHPDLIRMDYTTTLLPPKTAFLPTKEILLRMDVETFESPSMDRPNKPIAILGVHPCDLHGLARLDLAMREEPADAAYGRARRHALIIGLACVRRCRPEAFCDDMQVHQPAGSTDLFLTPVEGGYWVELTSDASVKIAADCGLFERPTEKQKTSFDHSRKQIERGFGSRRVNLKTLADNLEKTYADVYWEKLAERCFSCGACTAVCPTCVCFDVQDVLSNGCRTAERCRGWDSCLLKDFAAVAGGENFRPQRFQRLRHRMLRQGSYLAKRFNLPSFCVGCGRCPFVCLGKISPLEAFEYSQKGEKSRE